MGNELPEEELPIEPGQLERLSLLAGEVMERSDAELLASVLKALADPTRLRILSLIAGARDGEACVSELVSPTGLSQPTVSHHLNTLRKAGLLTRHKAGVYNYFRLNEAGLEAVSGLLAPDTKRRGRRRS